MSDALFVAGAFGAATLVGFGLGVRWGVSLGRESAQRGGRQAVKSWLHGLLLRLPGGRLASARLIAWRDSLALRMRLLDPLTRDAARLEQYILLGRSLEQQGLAGPAIEAFGKAIELAPADSRSYLARARALMRGGRRDEARADFEIALALPGGSPHDRLLAEISLASVRERPAEGARTESPWDKGAYELQTLIESHDGMAEYVINRENDFDTAVALYRKKQLLQQEFARTYGLTDLRTAFLPDDWVRNIGHIALLDFWVKMQKLGWRPWDRLILMAPPGATANTAYLKFWSRYFTVISDPHLLQAFTPLAGALGSRVAGVLDLPDGRPMYFCEGMGVIQEEWERNHQAPLLALTDEHQEPLQRALRIMGVPEGGWHVCLHVRSPGYHHETASIHQHHRNAVLHTYLPAIREIVARGGTVIRLGDPSMEPIPPVPGCYDYARSPLKSELLDVLLCASCTFFIGGPSGLTHVPASFGVPVALTNWVSNQLPVYGGRDLFIPKLIRSDKEQRLLRFEESLEYGVRRLSYSGEGLWRHGLRAVDNTADEILELVREMFDVVNGQPPHTAADADRQATYRTIALASGAVGFSRIGRSFLERHAGLLAHGAQPQTSR